MLIGIHANYKKKFLSKKKTLKNKKNFKINHLMNSSKQTKKHYLKDRKSRALNLKIGKISLAGHEVFT